MFSKHAEVRLSNVPCMLVSQLCSLLNTLPEYLQERERLGKKPMGIVPVNAGVVSGESAQR